MEDAIGTAYFDAVQLEQSPVANRYNLLYNSNLESISSSVPTSWQTSPNTTGQASSTEQKYSGLRAWKISGTNGVNRTLVQRVYRTGNAGDTFVFSAFAKAMSRPNDQGFGRFSIFLEFHDSTGTTDQFEAKFNYGSTDWQYVSDVAVTTAPYTYFIFYLSYYDNANEVYFDLPQVFMDNFGSSYVYDEDGNIVSASDLAKTESTFEYSGSNELVKQNNPTGTSYEYTYAADNPHRLVSATAGGVTTTYTYGSYGNVTSARTEREEGGGEYFESSATYTANGNYTATSTDTLGNTVSYNYNAAKGTLTSVTDPKGNATSYSYNANNDRLTSVTQGDSSVSYTYDDDRLATICTGDTTYTFIYDEAGNTANVKVGTRNLVTNTYDLSQGTLTSSVYGNGDEVSYDYDALGRVTAKYNDYSPLEPAFMYYYDNTGNLALVEDVENNCSTRYEYDAADRLVRVEDSSGLSVHYFYDEHNRQHKVACEVEGETVTQ